MGTVSLDDVKNAIEEFKAKYRRPKLPDLRLSGLYSLFPKKGVHPAVDTKWDAQWPHSDDAGVYFVFGEDAELLYIGKASMYHCVGKRLSTYFGTERGTGNCELLQKWEGNPMYVAVLPVSKDMTFEAAAIEEYLIKFFNPINNTRGVRKL